MCAPSTSLKRCNWTILSLDLLAYDESICMLQNPPFQPWQLTGQMICVDEMLPAFDHTDGLVWLCVTCCLGAACWGLQVLERQGWAYAEDSPAVEALSSSRVFQDMVCC